MTKKLSRILGIAGVGLILLPCIIWAADSISKLSLPSEPSTSLDDFPSDRGYASLFLLVSGIYSMVTVPGLIGSLLVNKKPKLAGILMLVSGVLMLWPEVPLYWRIGPLLLVTAGILALIEGKPVMPSAEPDDNGQSKEA